MRDRELYALLLGITAPSRVQEVELRLDDGEVVARPSSPARAPRSERSSTVSRAAIRSTNSSKTSRLSSGRRPSRPRSSRRTCSSPVPRRRRPNPARRVRAAPVSARAARPSRFACPRRALDGTVQRGAAAPHAQGRRRDPDRRRSQPRMSAERGRRGHRGDRPPRARRSHERSRPARPRPVRSARRRDAKSSQACRCLTPVATDGAAKEDGTTLRAVPSW